MNIVILGAGLMGRLLACELSNEGHHIGVFEAGGPDAALSAARAAAAMLAPLAESAITEANVVKMGMYALNRWPELIARLDQPVNFQRTGTLVLWHRQDAPEAERFARQLHATHARLPDLPAARHLDEQGVADLEPSIAGRFTQGLYLPGEGQLDNHQLLVALLHQLQRPNVELHWNSPRAPGDFSPGKPGQPDWVFDCRGVGAQTQWSALRGVRGEIIKSLKVSMQTVSNWKVRGVPVEHCTAVEQATNGRVTRQELCANWRGIWPELEHAPANADATQSA